DMGKIRLGYWDIRGRGQSIRLMLEYLGLDYDEIRYPRGDAPEFDCSIWLADKFKLGMDFPNLPYLIDGDTRITESWAIMKHLGYKDNLLVPGNKEQQTRCNMAEGVLEDFRVRFARLCYNQNFENLTSEYLEYMHTKLNYLDKFLDGSKWLVGAKLTYVDFLFCEILDQIRICFPGCLESYGHVTPYLARFDALERIASYRASDRYRKFPVNSKIAGWRGMKERI
uniref:glutathione transferase n=1 Tax=Ciona savignyi TaxID=51511 RepID=H2ZQB3_CIOSA